MGLKLLEEFGALGDDGKTYTVTVWQKIINAGTMGNPNATVDGKKSAMLPDGSPVNSLKDGTFQSVKNGVILTRL